MIILHSLFILSVPSLIRQAAMAGHCSHGRPNRCMGMGRFDQVSDG
jgi:hypothetical protein